MAAPDHVVGEARSLMLLATILLTVALPNDVFGDEKKRKNDDDGELKKSHNKRVRRFVTDIFDELGPGYVRRAMRMQGASYWKLLSILEVKMEGICNDDLLKEDSPKTWKSGAKNGRITAGVRLSAALRYFAGGRPDDIGLVHGISHSEVFNSVWIVVDAVNQSEALAIQFPEEHSDQRRLAAGFKTRSKAGFNACCGAIDGMLLWTEKPNLRDCEEAECWAKKFLCGRKKKFGMTLQGVCDSEARFLDVSIEHPASTSDYLAFSTSSLYHKLEEKNLLAPGLTLFGDSAYVNTRYMTTPFKNAKAGQKDDFTSTTHKFESR